MDPFGIRNGRRKLEYKIKNYISVQSLHMQVQNEGEGKEGSRTVSISSPTATIFFFSYSAFPNYILPHPSS